MTRIYIGLMGVYLNYHVHKTSKTKRFQRYTKTNTNYDNNKNKFNYKHKNENQRQEYKVCKTKIQMKCYFDNI